MREDKVYDVVVRKAEAQGCVVDDIVTIHLATFKGFFLTFMGHGFLQKMYLSYIQHEDSELYIAIENESVIGFLAYSKDMSGLYKFMIKRYILAFAWYSLGAFLRRPKVFVKLVRAFLKPGEAQRETRYVALSSIGVRPDMKGKGIGSQLLDALKKTVDFSEYAYIALETDAIDNEPVNQFYVKNGFRIARTFITPEGRQMHEYRYFNAEPKD